MERRRNPNATRQLYSSKPISLQLEERHILQRILPKDILTHFKPISVLSRTSNSIVFSAETDGGKIVAIKQYYEDPNIKNRELHILQRINNRNCVKLISSFYTPGKLPHSRDINIVTPLFPQTLSDYLSDLNKSSLSINYLYLRLFMYQLFSGLSYLNSLSIVHRDIDLSNLFVDEDSGILVIGDFGSAKHIRPNDTNTAYLVTRPYRAPELIYGCETYGSPIDVWAAGCVMAHLILGHPLFHGASSADQLQDIVRVLGPPPPEVIALYHPKIEIKTMTSASSSLENELNGASEEAIDLLKQIFFWDPSRRLTADECMLQPFFNDIFNGPSILPSGKPYPPLIRGNFSNFFKIETDE